MPQSSVRIPLARDAQVRFPSTVLRKEGVRAVAQELPRLLGRRGTQVLRLDPEGVEVPTAGGIGELVALRKRLRDAGGDLILCNLSDWAFQVFEVVRLTDLVEVR